MLKEITLFEDRLCLSLTIISKDALLKWHYCLSTFCLEPFCKLGKFNYLRFNHISLPTPWESPPVCIYSSSCIVNSTKVTDCSKAMFDRMTRSPSHIQTYYGSLIAKAIEFTWMLCLAPRGEWVCPSNWTEEVHLAGHALLLIFCHGNQ